MLRQVAFRFLITHELRLPLPADVALYAAGFWPLPAEGPTTLDGNIVRYDESRPTWQLEVWSLVCERLLLQEGFGSTPELRAELARWFGVSLDGRQRAAWSR